MTRCCSVAVMTVALALGALVGCGGRGFQAMWPDTRGRPRHDAHRRQGDGRPGVLARGRGARPRAPVAAARALRISDAIEDDQPFVAAALLDQLTSLWQDDPGAVGRGLAEHAALLRAMRAMFAKSGALEPAAQTLILLAEVEPAGRAARLAELDEVLGFADELAVAD